MQVYFLRYWGEKKKERNVKKNIGSAWEKVVTFAIRMIKTHVL